VINIFCHVPKQFSHLLYDLAPTYILGEMILVWWQRAQTTQQKRIPFVRC